MTKRQRAQVVELLRCAADGLSPAATAAWTDATEAHYDSAAMPASMAFHSVRLSRFIDMDNVHADCELGRGLFLEAAQRVEEGTWP